MYFNLFLDPVNNYSSQLQFPADHSCFAQTCSFLGFCFYILQIALEEGKVNFTKTPCNLPSGVIQAFAIGEWICLPKWSPNSFGWISQKQITERAQVQVLGWSPPPSPPVTALSTHSPLLLLATAWSYFNLHFLDCQGYITLEEEMKSPILIKCEMQF